MNRARVTICALLLGALATVQATSQITFVKHAYTPWSGSVAVGDFDRDGKPDVASISGNDNGGLLVIYKGEPGGNLMQTEQYSFNNYNNNAWVYTADVNADGILDLIISKEFTPELEMWYGNGDGTFRFGQILQLNRPSPLIGVGDLAGSGCMDIATFEQDDTGSGSQIYLNNCEGSFSTNSNLFFVQAPAGTLNFALADFNRDGKLDILYRTRDSLQLFAGNGDGTFSHQKTSAFPAGVGTMTAGSFNRDSALDVAVRIANPSGSSDTVYVLLNNGAGSFSLHSTIHAGTSMSAAEPITAADLNNDGVMDLVLADNGATKKVSYLLNTGTGTFGPEFTAGTTNGPVALPILRKMNADSRTDIVAPSASLFEMIATSGRTNCAPPGSGSLVAKICTPTNGGTTATTLTVRAAGNSPAGVVRMVLFVDGVKKYDVWDDQLVKTLTVPAGRHRITVWAYDRYAGIAKSTVYATAQ
jgi:hypothetical protein